MVAKLIGGTAKASGLAAWPRRRGAGQAAMDALIGELDARGITRIEITAATTGLAERYYPRWGFTSSGPANWLGQVPMTRQRSE